MSLSVTQQVTHPAFHWTRISHLFVIALWHLAPLLVVVMNASCCFTSDPSYQVIYNLLELYMPIALLVNFWKDILYNSLACAHLGTP